MSSALAMILAAAMAVPGNGPEMVSGEMEERLVLSGEWEGTFQNEGGTVLPVSYSEGRMTLGGRGPQPPDVFLFSPIDEGRGRFRLNEGELSPLGIYKWESGRVVMCFGSVGKERPTSFHGSKEEHNLLILHRVKPRK